MVLFHEAGKGLGILQRQGSAPGVGAKQSSRWNLSAVTLLALGSGAISARH